MKKEKGISVIVPIYNTEQYIQRCIDSLLAQTFKKDLEYIFVIDKNSNDNSEQIVKNSIKNIKNAIILKPENGSGPGFNRNRGIEAASKEYIGFHDSDDYSDSDFYERLYDYSQTFNADVVMGETTIKDFETGNEISRISLPFKIEYSLGKIFAFLPWCTCWDKIFKTNIVKNIRFLEGVFNEDHIFVLKAMHKANKLVVAPGSQYYYIKNPDAATKSPIHHHKIFDDMYFVFDVILDYLNTLDIPQTDKTTIIRHFIRVFAKNTLTDTLRGNKLKEKVETITGKSISLFL